MKRNFLIIFIAIFACAGFRAFAAEDDEIVKLQEEIQRLKEQIQMERDTIQKVQDIIDKKKDELTDIEDTNKRKYRKALAPYMFANNDSQDSIAKLQRKLNDLKGQRDDMEQQLRDNQDSIANLRSEQARKLNEEWSDKKYSEIDLNKLSAAITDAKNENNPDLSTVIANLENLQSLTIEYQAAADVLTKPYDSNKVAEALSKMKKLGQKSAPIRQAEVTIICDQLDSYPAAVKTFQDMIKNADEEGSLSSTHKGAWVFIEEVISKPETVTTIKSIPWLAQKYTEYYNAMSKDCKENHPIKQEILNLK